MTTQSHCTCATRADLRNYPHADDCALMTTQSHDAPDRLTALREALATEHSILRGPAHGYGGRPFETPGACEVCDLITGRAPLVSEGGLDARWLRCSSCHEAVPEPDATVICIECGEGMVFTANRLATPTEEPA